MEEERILGQIKINGESIELVRTHYADGRLAVIARTLEGAPYAKLSVNPGADVELPENCIAVKTWSENSQLFAAAAMCPYFMMTGKQLHFGKEVAPIWEVIG